MAGNGVARDDYARIARVVRHVENDPGFRFSERRQPTDVRLSQWMLLEQFAKPINHGDAEDELAVGAISRYLTAAAVQMQPVEARVQVLRQRFEWPFADTFQLRYGDELTDELNLDISAADLFTAINGLDALLDKVQVFGLESVFGPDAVEFGGRQWMVQFHKDVPAGVLLELVEAPTALVLFQDWWWPTDNVQTVWAGLPTDGRLRPGAFGFVQPFPARGYTWVHGECYTWEEG
jgi:hypothetical protein